jgi:hypothetical protein
MTLHFSEKKFLFNLIVKLTYALVGFDPTTRNSTGTEDTNRLPPRQGNQSFFLPLWTKLSPKTADSQGQKSHEQEAKNQLITQHFCD